MVRRFLAAWTKPSVDMVVAGEFFDWEVENVRRGSCAIEGLRADINVDLDLVVDPSARQMVWILEAGRRRERVAIVIGLGIFSLLI